MTLYHTLKLSLYEKKVKTSLLWQFVTQNKLNIKPYKVKAIVLTNRMKLNSPAIVTIHPVINMSRLTLYIRNM